MESKIMARNITAFIAKIKEEFPSCSNRLMHGKVYELPHGEALM